MRQVEDVLALVEKHTINLVDYDGSRLSIPRDVALKVGQAAVDDVVVVIFASLIVSFGTSRVVIIGNGIGL